MIVDYVDAHRDRFGVDPICTVLTEHGPPIAPSTYYAAKVRGPVSDTARAEAHAANTVHRLFLENRRLYGVGKMWHAMKHAGHDEGRDQVWTAPKCGVIALGLHAQMGSDSGSNPTLARCHQYNGRASESLRRRSALPRIQLRRAPRWA